MTEHWLDKTEGDPLPSGDGVTVVAVCTCKWKSGPHLNSDGAILAHERHRADLRAGKRQPTTDTQPTERTAP